MNKFYGEGKMRYLIILFVLSFCSNAAYAGELTYGKAKELALEHNRMIKAYEQALKAATYRYDQARGGYLPKINAVETGMRTDDPGNAAFAKIAQGKFDMTYFMNQIADPNPVINYGTKVELIQPIYLNGKIYYGIRQARQMRKASEYMLQRVKQQVLFNLNRAFYGLALAERALDVTRKSYDRTREYYQTSKHFYDNGMIVKSDLLVAQSYMLMNEGAIREAEKSVAVGKSFLQRVIGMGDDFDVVWGNPDEGFKTDLRYYVTLGLEKRQDLKSMEEYLRVNEYEIKKARAKYLPEVSAFANYQWNDDKLLGNSGNGYTVGAQVRINLFNGFSDYNGVKEQESLHQELLDKISDKKLEVEADVKDGYYSVLAAQKQLEAAGKRVEAADEALTITQNRFKAGILKVTDLLDREVEARKAQLDRYQSRYSLILSKAKLLFAAGILH
jgi:outer membrane protein TolC